VPYKEINSQLDSGARSGKIGQIHTRKKGGNPTSGGKIKGLGKGGGGHSNSY
jgi:hypothetical protein